MATARKNLYDEQPGNRFSVYGGCDIKGTIDEAIALAAKRGGDVSFDFNGVDVMVVGGSRPDLVYRDWSRAMNGYIDKKVGPYPRFELSDAEKARDAEIEAVNQARRDAESARHQRAADVKKAATDARLELAPPMTIGNAAMWQSWVDANQDGYGSATMRYTEQWARLMELEMATGFALEDIADATSREADTEGITGFMYGCAVGMLSKAWVHGESLRQWHNLKTQIRDEGVRANATGGVLNPALISIGV